AAGWAAVEALTTVIERFGLPDWMATFVTALYVAGLPVTVFLVWRTAGEERRLDLPSFVFAMTFLVLGSAAIFLLTRPPPAPPINIVAVVPCQFTGDAAFAYRAEGVAEDVHARLSRVDAVKISSWNSSLFVRDRGYGPRQIAETLSVNRVVTCYLTSESERIELKAELLDPEIERVIWANEYDFVAADLGSVVTELAGTLLDVLGKPAEAAEMDRVNNLGTFSPEAYDLFLQASVAHELEERDRLVEQVLAIDPNFADALVFRAGIFFRRSTSRNFESMEEPRKWLYEARSLSERAIEQDPFVLGARFILSRVCGMLTYYYDEPCQEGEPERLREEECEVRGETAEGWACWSGVLSPPEDFVAMERWLELEPTSMRANMQHAWRRREQGADFVEALAVFETLRALYPDDGSPYGMVSQMLRPEGRLDELLAWRYGSFEDRIPEGSPWELARLATDYMSLGLYEEASVPGEMTAAFRPSSAAHFMHILWALGGEPDKAAELQIWNGERTGAASPAGYLYAAMKFAEDLGDYELAKQYFDRALASQDLSTLCNGDDECVFWHALLLVNTERALANEEAAASWLKEAEAAAITLEDRGRDEPSPLPMQAAHTMLAIAQGRHAEAVEQMRQIVFAWDVTDEDLLALPIYKLEQAAVFDALRDRQDFRQLVDDYNTYLEPMRQRVREAEATGDWASLRRRTVEWANETARRGSPSSVDAT
ncbi:MAG: hypothetical protein OEU49_04675, partial [Chromatiales bacterium]|nr:hypothetical protein [Chromatiales bacterium]